MIRNNQLDTIDLKSFYDRTYSAGYKKVFTKYVDGKDTSETNSILEDIIDWTDKKVLDFGCGPGLTAKSISEKGAIVHGMDFSKNAIFEANKLVSQKLSFSEGSIDDIKGSYDVIISIGTIEHMESPEYAIKKFYKHLNPSGQIILTCPNWTNTGGYIQIALYYLFDLKITLSDLYFFSPYDFEEFASKFGMKLEKWFTFDHSLGNGDMMVNDIDTRLKNIFRGDARVPYKSIEKLTHWLKKNKKYTINSVNNGASAIYVFKKKDN